jgi:hypothetical protein
MLRDEINRLGHPNLLNEKSPADSEYSQAGLKCLAVRCEEPVSDHRILDHNKLSRVSVNPLIAVPLEQFQLSREQVVGHVLAQFWLRTIQTSINPFLIA